MLRNYLSIIWVRGLGALKADAEDSYLGTLWWILEPILLTLVFYLAFSSGLRGGDKGASFVFFLMCGLFPFKWTASIINNSANAISDNKGILGQFYLPKWIFPTAVSLTLTLRFMIVLPLLIATILIGGYLPTTLWIDLFPIVATQLILNLGLSYFTSSLVPIIPDLSNVIPISITCLLFTGGIFFDISERPAIVQEILYLNPLTGIIECYRDTLLSSDTVNTGRLIYPLTLGISLASAGLFLLKRLDRFYPRVL
ncbi:Teichoic acid translocation permease protein TagG [Microbulbifer aggregans]|uniref:Transport permease protein n=1 Tax=Microbulbifer aggregans TaxID=1769779 RepID=A0A1C9W9D4_9GAMM|nr:ABC transporter permease [Microbulbifer aggregans]AOS97769.1 Teichoic acid translocation permease protein TagG [Microbulbifer aggregans]